MPRIIYSSFLVETLALAPATDLLPPDDHDNGPPIMDGIMEMYSLNERRVRHAELDYDPWEGTGCYADGIDVEDYQFFIESTPAVEPVPAPVIVAPIGPADVFGGTERILLSLWQGSTHHRPRRCEGKHQIRMHNGLRKLRKHLRAVVN